LQWTREKAVRTVDRMRRDTTASDTRSTHWAQVGAWTATGTFAALAATIAARGGKAAPADPDALARTGAVFGVAMHAALVPVIAALPAPRWARRAGYAWVAIDIAANTLTLASTGDATTTAIRLVGHLGAAAWIFSASREAGRATRLVGSALAAWLFAYTLLAPVVPDAAFTPAVPLMLAWLTLVARTFRRGHPTRPVTVLPAQV
jgi:hypothetical protein